MKKIIYYVTDHGQGHATRTVALIRSLEKFNYDIIIRNHNQKFFFEKSLLKSVIIDGTTDVGPTIAENGISVNKQASVSKLKDWISNLNETSQKEYETISKLDPSLIISDISAMPFLVAKKLQLPSIAISNFCWSDVLFNILDETQLQILDDAYDFADFAIRLSLGTELKPFKNKKNVGLVSRVLTKSKKEIRSELGVKDDEFLIFVPLGSYHKLLGKFDQNVKVITGGAQINTPNIVRINDWVEGQDLVNASDLVICKCGYGLISECLTNGISFFYLMDDQHLEQIAMSKKIMELGFDNRIIEKDLENLNFTKSYFENFTKPKTEKNDTSKVSDMVNQFLTK